MATIADLRMRPSMRHAYLLLIEGVPFAFTDEPALATSWWAEDSRVIKLGLAVPEGLKMQLELESGLLEEDQAVFRLLDLDSTVPQFFGGLSKQYKGLGARLSPLDSPAPASVDNNGNLLVLESVYIGTEAIGPAGERNFYSATPVWAEMPGQDHPAFDPPLPVVTNASTGPYLVEGRRVFLYRLIYDPDTGTWPSYTAQVTAAVSGGWSPALWWGTLRQAGKVDGRIWSINCVGPGSLIRRPFNSRTTTDWYGVTAAPVVDANQLHIGVELEKRYFFDGSHIVCGSDLSTYSADVSSKANLVASINTAINAVVGAMGPGGDIWNADAGIGAGTIDFTADQVTIKSEKVDGFYAMYCRLTMSHIVWTMLGYAPEESQGIDDGPQPRFTTPSFDFIGANPDIFVDPPPIYNRAVFTTVPEGQDPIGFTGELDWAGTKAPRVYTPLYSGGVSTLTGAGGQVVSLTPPDNGPIYCESQTIRARESTVEINGNPCNAAGWWAFRGKLQLPPQFTGDDPEVVDTVQVARCLWVEGESGLLAADEYGISRGLYIQEWLDPRLFGLNYEPLDHALGWASSNEGEQIEASPLRVLGAFHKRPDKVTDTLLRILCSTGQAYWDAGAEDTADSGAKGNAGDHMTEGTNSLGLAWPAGDYEIYDLGLQIPAQMIDVPSIQAAADDLPGGAGGPLGQSKICIQGGPLQSEELLSAIMAPRGWALSLHKGKYGLWTPHINPEVAFEELGGFTITESDLHGVAGDPASVIPGVELRPVYPFERVQWTHTGNPTEDWLSGQEELKFKARDPGSRARSGAVIREVAAPDLVATSWFAGDPGTNPNVCDLDQLQTWAGDAVELWERLIPTWLAQPHRKIEGLRISRPQGQDLYPGACIKLSNPWPANSVGGYGVNGFFARVISVTHETDSCACIVDAIIYAQAPGALRWAPVVRVVDDAATPDERYDEPSKTFFLQDWGGLAPPVQWFIKPDFVASDPGNACVWILQYDGTTWDRTGIAFVESVDVAAKTLTLTAAGITGTFLERQYTLIVLAPSDYEDQVQWVRELFPIHVLANTPTEEPPLPP